MCGLRQTRPITGTAWMLSTRALTGIFPFAGFWSKDEIIDNVGNNGYTVLMWVALGGAALTAMYMTRATYLVFFGEPRGAAAGEHHGDEAHAEEHEMETISVGAPEPRSLGAAANALVVLVPGREESLRGAVALGNEEGDSAPKACDRRFHVLRQTGWRRGWAQHAKHRSDQLAQ